MNRTEYDFKIGVPVHAAEGEAGRLKYVVVDPDAEAVTHLVVERGRLGRHDVVVPVGWVEQADASGIRVNATLAELESLPEFRAVEFWAPDPTARPVAGHLPADMRIWISAYEGLSVPHAPRLLQRVRLSIDADEILIRRGLPVYAAEADRVGTLDHLLIDPTTQRVTHLVIHCGGWLSQGEDYIASMDQVASVSEYGIHLRLGRAEIGQLRRYRLPSSDGQIRTEAMRSLETQPETRGQGWRVEVERGLVRLFGEVSEAVAQAATRLIRSLWGVIGVEDRTTRPGEPGFRIGVPVFALDGRIGHLHKVVVDPHTRRVSHLIVHRGFLLDEDRVVPVELVERSTAEGIIMHLTSQEVSRLPRYHEACFRGPPPDWEPLPGYEAADILFWGPPDAGVVPPGLPVVEYTIRHGIPERTVVLERNTEVRTRDEAVGEIDYLLVDPLHHELTHLVVRLDDQPQQPVIVPFAWVEDLGDGYVLLGCTREDLRRLPAQISPTATARSSPP
jgi:sporulation protein YlmC with PRC-barrel domain